MNSINSTTQYNKETIALQDISKLNLNDLLKIKNIINHQINKIRLKNIDTSNYDIDIFEVMGQSRIV
tara:strand:- start:491 stop:691 length:201 start_codon:yes stop_codon:yes gene_type:complete